MILALAGALDAIGSHCDRLVDGLASEEARVADTTGAFGQDITHLRAEVLHLQRLAASLNPTQDE
jgi:phosphoribosylformimino-5-aminoimidazole carboxamide ribonucleotide (ProFAR) isomerase